jgi:hypothetical protein
MGIKYRYEPEGYNLGKYGCYLPDFYLPDLGDFVEVKGSPDVTTAYEDRLAAFTCRTGNKLLLVPCDPYGL